MSASDHSEYDVVSFRVNPGVVSVLCVVFPIFLGIAIEELPYVLGGRLRPYYGTVVLTALGFNVVGIALGAMAMRRPPSRGAGRIGILVNAVVLILLGLFLAVFRWIRWGQLSWF